MNPFNANLAFFAALIALHNFFTTRFGIGNRLIWYLALPRIDVTTFSHKVMIENMIKRRHPEDSLKANCAPQDVGIFKRRMNRLAADNTAYRLAMKENPTVQDLEEISYLDASWSWLFPIKHYLMQHLDLAKDYKGLVPFGGEVIKFCNTLTERLHVIPLTPDYDDHVWLQEITIREALLSGMPTIEINNLFYLFGKGSISCRIEAISEWTGRTDVSEADEAGSESSGTLKEGAVYKVTYKDKTIGVAKYMGMKERPDGVQPDKERFYPCVQWLRLAKNVISSHWPIKEATPTVPFLIVIDDGTMPHFTLYVHGKALSNIDAFQKKVVFSELSSQEIESLSVGRGDFTEHSGYITLYPEEMRGVAL